VRKTALSPEFYTKSEYFTAAAGPGPVQTSHSGPERRVLSRILPKGLESPTGNKMKI
jgi:hypothetical protein